jgi:hypothetical protein
MVGLMGAGLCIGGGPTHSIGADGAAIVAGASLPATNLSAPGGSAPPLADHWSHQLRQLNDPHKINTNKRDPIIRDLFIVYLPSITIHSSKCKVQNRGRAIPHFYILRF